MFFFLKRRDSELIMRLNGGVVQGNIVAENFRNCRLLEDRLPWALRLARTAINAFIRVDVELIWELFPVFAYVLVNAINRTNTHAAGIDTIYAKAGYRPWHVSLTPPKN